MHKENSGPIPVEREDTVRHQIVEFLKRGPASAGEISQTVHVSEKDVYGHLEHIRLSVKKHGMSLEVVPSECRKCGFVFRKRERLKSPGKCPVCRSEMISDPLYRISE